MAERFFISRHTEITPTVAKVMKAFDKVDPKREAFWFTRLKQVGDTVTFRTYTEGYVTETRYGQVGAMPSAGGDYLISYQVTPDREVEVRKFQSLEIRVTGTQVEVVCVPWTGYGEAFLFKARGFGRKGEEALKTAASRFRHLQEQCI